MASINKIVASWWTALKKKLVDPSKMLEQSIVDCKVRMVKCADAMTDLQADLKLTKDDLKETKVKIERKTKAAKEALKADKENDARSLLSEKQVLEVNAQMLADTIAMIEGKVTSLKEDYNKQVDLCRQLECRRSAASMKLKLADVQNKLNGLGIDDSVLNPEESFATYEREADKIYEKSKAVSELKRKESTALEDKYLGALGDASIEKELEQLKASIRAEG